MFPQGRKYFRVCFGLVLAFVFVPPTSPTHQESVPTECIVVASYALKTDWKETNLVDAKLLKNSISCIHELYKIWREARNMPQEVRDLVCKASNVGESISSTAKRGELSSFVPLYLLCRTLDLYDRSMKLDIDFKTYRKEFEFLRAELHQVTDLIDKELMPLWDHLDGATLHVITSKLIGKLRRFHPTLRQLAQVIYEDIKKAHSSRKWAGVYGVASTAVCVGSIFIGNVPGSIACAAGALTGISLVSLTRTIHKLTSLLHDMTIMANEIEEYRILLEQKPIPGICFGISNSFLFLSVFLWLFYQRKAQERDQCSLTPRHNARARDQ